MRESIEHFMWGYQQHFRSSLDIATMRILNILKPRPGAQAALNGSYVRLSWFCSPGGATVNSPGREPRVIFNMWGCMDFEWRPSAPVLTVRRSPFRGYKWPADQVDLAGMSEATHKHSTWSGRTAMTIARTWRGPLGAYRLPGLAR